MSGQQETMFFIPVSIESLQTLSSTSLLDNLEDILHHVEALHADWVEHPSPEYTTGSSAGIHLVLPDHSRCYIDFDMTETDIKGMIIHDTPAYLDRSIELQMLLLTIYYLACHIRKNVQLFLRVPHPEFVTKEHRGVIRALQNESYLTKNTTAKINGH
jgi:hypothetical protein